MRFDFKKKNNKYARNQLATPICMAAFLIMSYSPDNNYIIELHKYLSKADSFSACSNIINDEMGKLKLNDWYYSRLDVTNDLTANSCLGAIDPCYIKQYISERFFLCDLSLESGKAGTKPFLQSQLIDMVNSAPFVNPGYQQFKKLVLLNNAYGYSDTYAIPLKSSFNGGTFLFCTSAKGLDPTDFRKSVKANSSLLATIGQTIDNVGVIKFPASFIETKKNFDKLINSNPFKVLAATGQHNLDVKGAAIHFNTSVKSIRNSLNSIRLTLGTNTISGAYIKAKEFGYF
ncbi:hypothetical protein JYU12_02760 [bacterium AH-315-K03]|nr:hypothetical protein [bacterium AH-315-K03]